MKKKAVISCIKLPLLHLAVILSVLCVQSACSDNEEKIEGSLLTEYNLYVIDDDTLSYNYSDVVEPFNLTDEKIGSALEDYAITMLIDYSKNNKKNTMLSPMSATLLYSMISSLTDETSGSQCQKQLGLGSFSQDDVISYCRKLNYQTKSSEEVNKEGSMFSVSNNCWIQEKEAVYKSFVSITKSYGIGVKGIDFRSQSGLSAIGQSLNGSSFSNSNGTGMTAIGNVTSIVTTSMDLQKKWKNQLSYVRDSTFTNADGTVSVCRKLGGTFKLKYGNLDSFDIVEFPYNDSAFSLYIVYPHSYNLFDRTLNYIQNNGIEKCINNLSEVKISVHIPAFNIEGVTELNSSTASSESVGTEFHQAKLTKASPNGFNIGNTYQAYHIELNTQGTSVEVKSGGTVINTNESITIGTGASPGGGASITEFHIDRPFVVFIRNNNLKTIAYACCIKDLSD